LNTEEKKPLDPEDVDRLVARRAWLGEFLADLWRYSRSHDLGTLDHRRARAWHLLLGAAFSLWRAAFLIKGSRTPTVFHSQATQSLEEVLWTNAISFGKDLSTHEWSSGYYLNSAALRLSKVPALLPNLGAHTAFQEVEAFLDSSLGPAVDLPALKDGWDACQAAAALERLQETGSAAE
jgi:hypothetical protein